MNYARFAKFPEEILHARNLSLADRMVFADMAFQAWFGDSCFISQARISTRLGISARQVRRSQAKLEAERYITALETGSHKVTTYRLNSRVFTMKRKPNYGDMVSSSIRKNADMMSSLSRNNRTLQ